MLIIDEKDEIGQAWREGYIAGLTAESEIKTAVNKIATHYGFENQLVKLIEECGEYQTAAAKFLLKGENYENFCEEIADILNVVEQMRLFIGADKMDKIRIEKLERQLKRMERESSEK